MNGKVQRQKHARPGARARRQQALLVRAVVGSLVLCAALAPPALGQSGATQIAQSEVTQFRPIRTRPLRELLAKAQRLVEAGELSTQDTFDFTLEAERNADGTLRDIKFTELAAVNGRWQPLVREFVTVLSDSGALSVLPTDAERLTLTLRLDDRATARLQTVVKSGERATELAQIYHALLDRGRSGRSAGVEVLNNMAVSANGKQLSMQLEMSREQAGNLLRKHRSLP